MDPRDRLFGDGADDPARLIQAAREGERRAQARIISCIENNHPLRQALLTGLYPLSRGVHCIGVTGSPGVGKSTLVSRLIREVRAQGLRVAVVAVDPNSPLTGGAVLGDRIRMMEHLSDPGVFIRSMSSRGTQGGLASTIWEVLQALDAFGYDRLLIETAGAGQTDVSVRDFADTVVLTLMPRAGDSVQAIKSGIMEVADVYAVNKADLPGAAAAVAEIRQALALARLEGWKPPVVAVSATEQTGIGELWAAIERHRTFLSEEERRKKRRNQFRERMLWLLKAATEEWLLRRLQEDPSLLETTLDRVERLEQPPADAAKQLLRRLIDTEAP